MKHLAVSCALLMVASCGDDDTGSNEDAAIVDMARADVVQSPDGTDRDTSVDDDAEPPPDQTTPLPARTLWVSVGGEQRVAVAELGGDGALSARADDDIMLSDRPGAMTYARTSQRIYVGLRAGAIATIDLDGPTVLAATPDTGDPVYLELTTDEATLFTAYHGDDRIRTHDASGAPPFPELASARTANQPHAVVRSPGGLFYVPHRGGNSVAWYRLADDGRPTRVDSIDALEGEGPRHMTFHPDGLYAYVIMEDSDSIALYDVADDGALTRRDSWTTLPEDFDGAQNTCADIHITPDGRFVYGSNRGHDSIAMFAVADDGALEPLGTVDTEPTPREFSVSPDGGFVVVAGQASGFLQSYAVGADGRLTSADRLEVGPDLRWVIID